MKITISFEETTVLVAVHKPMLIREAADRAVQLVESPKFDLVVALDTIRSLITQGLLIHNPGSREVGPTQTGKQKVQVALDVFQALDAAYHQFHHN
jgi:hypothetical protein